MALWKTKIIATKLNTKIQVSSTMLHGEKPHYKCAKARVHRLLVGGCDYCHDFSFIFEFSAKLSLYFQRGDVLNKYLKAIKLIYC